MISIKSADNIHFKRWKSLSKSQGIKKHKEFILMGKKLISEFLKNPHFEILCELTTDDQKPITQANHFHLSNQLFTEVDVIGTHYNLLVLKMKDFPSYKPQDDNGFELICPLGDPINLGAMTRSALAFGVTKVVLTTESALPFHPKAIKGSAGAVLNMYFEQTGTLQHFLSLNLKIYALDTKGDDLSTFSFPKNFKLIVGEEGPGLTPNLGNHIQRLSISTQNVESLNATTASSIAMFLYSRSLIK